MAALIESRAIPLSETDPSFPIELAKLSWAIADAMHRERVARAIARRPR
jgi:hypothetical protein